VHKLFQILFVLLAFGAGLPLIAQPVQSNVTIYDSVAAKGYYFLYAGRMVKDDVPRSVYLLIMDGTGHIVYYKETPKATNFALQPSGLMSYFQNEKFFLMDSTFRVVDSVGCINGIKSDSHDFIAMENGHYLLIGTESQPANLRMYKMFLQKEMPGSKNGELLYGVVQELDADKKFVYEWRGRAFFSMDDVSRVYPMDTNKLDVTHFNSIAPAPDGNYIISARYSNEVVKVNKQDGSIIWRLGGNKNSFKFLNDSVPFFGQHDARYVAPNRITLFDNGYGWDYEQHAARAVEYEIDETNMTAKLVWSYTYPNRIISEAAGNAQRLANGNTLVNYSKIKNHNPNLSFVEVKPDGSKVIEVSFPDTLGSYRVFHYPDLPFTIKQPTIKVKVKKGLVLLSTTKKYTRYKWSDGSNDKSLAVFTPGNYFVYVSSPSGGFVSSKMVMVTKEMLQPGKKKSPAF
jgi:hypothetical protein